MLAAAGDPLGTLPRLCTSRPAAPGTIQAAATTPSTFQTGEGGSGGVGAISSAHRTQEVAYLPSEGSSSAVVLPPITQPHVRISTQRSSSDPHDAVGHSSKSATLRRHSLRLVKHLERPEESKFRRIWQRCAAALHETVPELLCLF
jgi:hypothetical protein